MDPNKVGPHSLTRLLLPSKQQMANIWGFNGKPSWKEWGTNWQCGPRILLLLLLRHFHFHTFTLSLLNFHTLTPGISCCCSWGRLQRHWHCISLQVCVNYPNDSFFAFNYVWQQLFGHWNIILGYLSNNYADNNLLVNFELYFEWWHGQWQVQCNDNDNDNDNDIDKGITNIRK